MELFSKLRILAAGLLLHGLFNLSSQVQEPGIAEIIEEISENNDGVISDEWVEYLYGLSESPMNINSASRGDLALLRFLSPYQIENLHYYIYQYGAIQTLYELLAIRGFDKQTVQWMSVFFTAEPDGEISYSSYKKTDTVYVKQEAMARFGRTAEKLKGTVDGSFMGSPWQVMYKHKAEFNNSFLGIVYEKDAGERFWDYQNKKPEYLSFVYERNSDGYLKKLLIGNFRVNFGQGLSLWQNFGFGKSSMVLNAAKTGSPFSKHTSASEYNYFKGVAVVLGKGNFEYALFASSRKADASIKGDSSQLFVTSDSETGYHRTENEMARKGALRQSALGARGVYRFGQVNVGGNFHGILYDVPLQIANTDTTGKQFFGASFDVLYTGAGFITWGEAATDLNGNYAGLWGVNLYPTATFSASLLTRWFQKGYTVTYSSPFSERGTAGNEQGIYLGLEVLPFSGLKVQSYIDLYRFPAPVFNVSMPSSGVELFSSLNYTLNSGSEVSLRLKYEQKEKNFPGERFRHVKPFDKYLVRLNAKTKLSEMLSIQSRVDYVRSSYSGKPESGWLALQDIYIDLQNPKLSIDLRVAFFNTDSYHAGIYVYEPDVLYAFSVPVYYGKGNRFIVNMNYRLTDKITFYAKLGRFVYYDRDLISSGVTQINGPQKTDLRFQIRIKL